MGGGLFADDICTEIYAREWSALNGLVRTCKTAASRMTPAVMDQWAMRGAAFAVTGGLRSVTAFPNDVRHGATIYSLVTCTVTADYDRGELTRLMAVECEGASTRLAVKGVSKYLRAVQHDDRHEITVWPGCDLRPVDAYGQIVLDDVLRRHASAGDMRCVIAVMLSSAGAHSIIGDVTTW